MCVSYIKYRSNISSGGEMAVVVSHNSMVVSLITASVTFLNFKMIDLSHICYVKSEILTLKIISQI